MLPSTFTIYPTRKYNVPTPPTLRLHGLDLLSAPIQIHNHRFYHAPTSTFADMLATLKHSLAEALELYPPISGTLTDEQDEVYLRMDSVMGTPFLVDIKTTPYVGDTEDLSPRTDAVLPRSASILAVKVTQFSCGTIALASAINHQVTDLCGFLDFLETWAQLARGGQPTHVPTDWTHQPGRFFKPAEPSDQVPPPFKVLPTVSGPPPFLLARSAVTRWKLDKSALAQLKQDFSPGESWISSGDALAALVSGAITRARKHGNVARLEGRSTDDHEVIAMAANGRERGAQDMTSYFGNFNPLWSASASRLDLLDVSCGSRVAMAIRTALQTQLAPEAIARKIAFFETPIQGGISWAADIILTNWCRFDLQDLRFDLGWGKPFYATPGTGGVFPPGYCLMTMNKGDTFLLVTVEVDAEHHLLADPLLNKYATLLS